MIRTPPSQETVKAEQPQVMMAFNPGERKEFDVYFDRLMTREGRGFSYFRKGEGNDPPTKMGITINTFRKKYPGASVEDLKNMTEVQAKEIYHDFYYKHYGIDKVPEEVREQTFDLYVNHSPKGVRQIQKNANRFKELPRGNALVEGRREYYHSLVVSNPEKEVFMDGWMNRAEVFRNGPNPHLGQAIPLRKPTRADRKVINGTSSKTGR